MYTSVLRKYTFSTAGITISKQHNQLRGDIIKALQFLKCFFLHDLLFREAKDLSIASETPSDGLATNCNNSIDSDETKEGSGWDELVDNANLDADASSNNKMQGLGADVEDITELD